MELTTETKCNECWKEVVYDVKDTKFEWNSQRFLIIIQYLTWLFMMSKIQNLNGTHNPFEIEISTAMVVYDVKDTKFEWNSQQILHIFLLLLRLFMMSKIQNLNGTHNGLIIRKRLANGCL